MSIKKNLKLLGLCLVTSFVCQFAMDAHSTNVSKFKRIQMQKNQPVEDDFQKRMQARLAKSEQDRVKKELDDALKQKMAQEQAMYEREIKAKNRDLNLRNRDLEIKTQQLNIQKGKKTNYKLQKQGLELSLKDLTQQLEEQNQFIMHEQNRIKEIIGTEEANKAALKEEIDRLNGFIGQQNDNLNEKDLLLKQKQAEFERQISDIDARMDLSNREKERLTIDLQKALDDNERALANLEFQKQEVIRKDKENNDLQLRLATGTKAYEELDRKFKNVNNQLVILQTRLSEVKTENNSLTVSLENIKKTSTEDKEGLISQLEAVRNQLSFTKNLLENLTNLYNKATNDIRNMTIKSEQDQQAREVLINQVKELQDQKTEVENNLAIMERMYDERVEEYRQREEENRQFLMAYQKKNEEMFGKIVEEQPTDESVIVDDSEMIPADIPVENQEPVDPDLLLSGNPQAEEQIAPEDPDVLSKTLPLQGKTPSRKIERTNSARI